MRIPYIVTLSLSLIVLLPWSGAVLVAFIRGKCPKCPLCNSGRIHRSRRRGFEWTLPKFSRGVEYMDDSYRLLDLTVCGRQERFEGSSADWLQPPKGTDTMRADGRPLAQWPRLKAGYSDDLGTSTR